MPTFLIDTSCMVALVCGWHPDHARATTDIARRRDRGEEMVVAGHALVETYSVLTRLPPPHRMSPLDCLALIEDNFVRSASVVALEPSAYVDLLRNAAADGVAGGRVYDALIAACARVAGVDALLTFNERHFTSFGGLGMAIIVPAPG